MGNITKEERIIRQLSGGTFQKQTAIASEMFLPNHSGDHSHGLVLSAPTKDTDITNKAYVDGLISGLSTVYLKLNQSTPQTLSASPYFNNLTSGRVIFSGANKELNDDSSFVWDNTNKRLGIGISSPTEQMDLSGNINLKITSNEDKNGIIYKGGNRFIHDFYYGNNGTVTTVGKNIFIGENAGNLTTGSTATETTQGSYNIGIGLNSLSSNTTGYFNTGIGSNSLRSNTTGYFNTGIGSNSLTFNTEGILNIGIGSNSLRSNTTGKYSTGIGYNALYYNTTGNSNLAIGYFSLYSNTTGITNTGIGSNSLRSNTTGNYNTAVGYLSLYSNTTGSNNTAVGNQAGRYIADGLTDNQDSKNSVYLGNNTFPKASGDINETVIGYGAVGEGSNTVTIGNTSITSFKVGTALGINATIVTAALTPGGSQGSMTFVNGILTAQTQAT